MTVCLPSAPLLLTFLDILLAVGIHRVSAFPSLYCYLRLRRVFTTPSHTEDRQALHFPNKTSGSRPEFSVDTSKEYLFSITS